MSRSTLHICLHIDADWYRWGKFVTIEGRPVTSWEFENIRAELKSKGYTAFPPCDNADATGHCAGHPLPDEPGEQLELPVGP